ncbi:hypothetical protein MOMA_00700 [Moraxella macacae 0408225]|uniref:DUF3108 domain-containing protein n=1 Tax=Moraxella macacae 0408225 TaxID=1230338 RepID=L2F7X5_9GAMM|nr:DUF3108 domain-containing protein [Moraxella macacae]ELA08886.1 hypothetical protein MOMA_00700 [Moraxella macacae 0408225]
MTSSAMGAISPFLANYNVNIEDKYQGLATRTLKQDGDHWIYSVNATVGKLASANLSATFSDTNGAIMPKTSSKQYKILGLKRSEMLTFDPSNKQYTSSYKDKNRTISMPTIAYDDLSLEVQIREDLKANKFRGQYRTAGRNKAEMATFTKSENSKINVPAGSFEVIRIDRVHDDKQRQTSFWLAPKLDYLPIKVIQNNDGKKIEMHLTKIN